MPEAQNTYFGVGTIHEAPTDAPDFRRIEPPPVTNLVQQAIEEYQREFIEPIAGTSARPIEVNREEFERAIEYFRNVRIPEPQDYMIGNTPMPDYNPEEVALNRPMRRNPQVRHRLYDGDENEMIGGNITMGEKFIAKSRVLDDNGEMVGVVSENNNGQIRGFKLISFENGNADGVAITLNRNEAEKLFKFLKSRFEPEGKNNE
jgi:hypothetical protein